MMKIIHLVRYILKSYMRTSKYIMPFIFFIIFIFIYYSERPISIWANYSFTIIIMFVFSTWISFGFINYEDIMQLQLTILHVGNETTYYICRIISAGILLFFFDLCIVLSPIVLHLFYRSLTIREIIIAIIIHVIINLFGISISALFDYRLIGERKMSLIGLTLIGLLSIVQYGIVYEFPLFKYISWVLPPIYFLSDMLNNTNNNIIFVINKSFFKYLAYSLLYSITLILTYIKLIRRKKF